jgi:hypothetical protein
VTRSCETGDRNTRIWSRKRIPLLKTLFRAGQIACDFSLYWTQIHQLRFVHVLLYLSRKKWIRVIHLKEALFNIATVFYWAFCKKRTFFWIFSTSSLVWKESVPKCLIIFDEPKGGVDNFFWKKWIRVIHLKEALFNIATKTTIFVEKNVITCNIAVTKYQ